MCVIAKPEPKASCPATVRRRKVAARLYRSAAPCKSGARPALVAKDRCVIERMEILADILACIFLETQERDKIGSPQHKQEMASKAIDTDECGVR